MNNQTIADFAVWLRYLAFFSINVLHVCLSQKKAAKPCQTTNVTIVPHYS